MMNLAVGNVDLNTKSEQHDLSLQNDAKDPLKGKTIQSTITAIYKVSDSLLSESQNAPHGPLSLKPLQCAAKNSKRRKVHNAPKMQLLLSSETHPLATRFGDVIMVFQFLCTFANVMKWKRVIQFDSFLSGLLHNNDLMPIMALHCSLFQALYTKKLSVFTTLSVNKDKNMMAEVVDEQTIQSLLADYFKENNCPLGDILSQTGYQEIDMNTRIDILLYLVNSFVNSDDHRIMQHIKQHMTNVETIYADYHGGRRGPKKRKAGVSSKTEDETSKAKSSKKSSKVKTEERHAQTKKKLDFRANMWCASQHYRILPLGVDLDDRTFWSFPCLEYGLLIERKKVSKTASVLPTAQPDELQLSEDKSVTVASSVESATEKIETEWYYYENMLDIERLSSNANKAQNTKEDVLEEFRNRLTTYSSIISDHYSDFLMFVDIIKNVVTVDSDVDSKLDSNAHSATDYTEWITFTKETLLRLVGDLTRFGLLHLPLKDHHGRETDAATALSSDISVSSTLESFKRLLIKLLEFIPDAHFTGNRSQYQDYVNQILTWSSIALWLECLRVNILWVKQKRKGVATVAIEVKEKEQLKAGDFCEVCFERGDELVTCDACKSAWHLACLDPPLKVTPRRGWLCEGCDDDKSGFEIDDDGEKESDDEEDDGNDENSDENDDGDESRRESGSDEEYDSDFDDDDDDDES